MNILISNDDGYDAEGIWVLARALKKYGDVTMVAPLTQRSAFSHSIVMNRGILFEYKKTEDGIDCYVTDGTPADCVRLATSVLDKKFDLVFAGVNNGQNCGTDVIYSGTIAIAVEAIIEGIPAVALSADYNGFHHLAKLDEILEYVFTNKIYSKNYAININFPISSIKESKGIKWTIQGSRKFKTEFGKQSDGLYYQISNNVQPDDNPETDVSLTIEGYTTITKVGLNMIE